MPRAISFAKITSSSKHYLSLLSERRILLRKRNGTLCLILYGLDYFNVRVKSIALSLYSRIRFHNLSYYSLLSFSSHRKTYVYQDKELSYYLAYLRRQNHGGQKSFSSSKTNRPYWAAITYAIQRRRRRRRRSRQRAERGRGQPSAAEAEREDARERRRVTGVLCVTERRAGRRENDRCSKSQISLAYAAELSCTGETRVCARIFSSVRDQRRRESRCYGPSELFGIVGRPTRASSVSGEPAKT